MEMYTYHKTLIILWYKESKLIISRNIFKINENMIVKHLANQPQNKKLVHFQETSRAFTSWTL